MVTVVRSADEVADTELALLPESSCLLNKPIGEYAVEATAKKASTSSKGWTEV